MPDNIESGFFSSEVTTTPIDPTIWSGMTADEKFAYIASHALNETEYDRLYTVDQMTNLFKGIITDGVASGVGDNLRVSKYSVTPGNHVTTVLISPGQAWISGRWIVNSAESPIDLLTPQPSKDSAYILYAQLNEEAREMTFGIELGFERANGDLPSDWDGWTRDEKYLYLSNSFSTGTYTGSTFTGAGYTFSQTQRVWNKTISDGGITRMAICLIFVPSGGISSNITQAAFASGHAFDLIDFPENKLQYRSTPAETYSSKFAEVPSSVWIAATENKMLLDNHTGTLRTRAMETDVNDLNQSESSNRLVTISIPNAAWGDGRVEGTIYLPSGDSALEPDDYISEMDGSETVIGGKKTSIISGNGAITIAGRVFIGTVQSNGFGVSPRDPYMPKPYDREFDYILDAPEVSQLVPYKYGHAVTPGTARPGLLMHNARVYGSFDRYFFRTATYYRPSGNENMVYRYGEVMIGGPNAFAVFPDADPNNTYETDSSNWDTDEGIDSKALPNDYATFFVTSYGNVYTNVSENHKFVIRSKNSSLEDDSYTVGLKVSSDSDGKVTTQSTAQSILLKGSTVQLGRKPSGTASPKSTIDVYAKKFNLNGLDLLKIYNRLAFTESTQIAISLASSVVCQGYVTSAPLPVGSYDTSTNPNTLYLSIPARRSLTLVARSETNGVTSFGVNNISVKLTVRGPYIEHKKAISSDTVNSENDNEISLSNAATVDKGNVTGSISVSGTKKISDTNVLTDKTKFAFTDGAAKKGTVKLGANKVKVVGKIQRTKKYEDHYLSHYGYWFEEQTITSNIDVVNISGNMITLRISNLQNITGHEDQSVKVITGVHRPNNVPVAIYMHELRAALTIADE